jgi:hypothetical protein
MAHLLHSCRRLAPRSSSGTQGNTFEETLANIKEAIELYLETLTTAVEVNA